jgi:hypothetical protein
MFLKFLFFWGGFYSCPFIIQIFSLGVKINMDLNTAIEMMITQGPFTALFIWLLMDTNRKNEAREHRMQEQLDKTVPILNQIVSRLDVIEDKIR